MQAIHGNPHYRPQLEQADITRQAAAPNQGKPANRATPGRAAVDRVDLSAAAKQLLETAGPGKSGNSPAHQARAEIAAHPALADLPFGQVVKAINHGTLDTLVTPPAAETDEAEAVDPVAAEETADPAGTILPGTDAPDGTSNAPVEDSADGLPAQTVPDTETEASLLDLLDGVEDDAEAEQPG